MGWSSGLPKQLTSKSRIKESYNSLDENLYVSFYEIKDDKFWFSVDVPQTVDLWEDNKTYFLRIPVYKTLELAEKIIGEERITLKDLQDKAFENRIEMYRLTWRR